MTKNEKLIIAGNAIVEQVGGYAEVDAQLRDAINKWARLAKSPTSPRKTKPTSEAVPLAEHLLQRVTEASTATLLTNVAASAAGIAKILRAGVGVDLIRDTIDWLFDVNINSDYPFEVESGRALHAKWDRIQIAMNRQKPVKVKGGYY